MNNNQQEAAAPQDKDQNKEQAAAPSNNQDQFNLDEYVPTGPIIFGEAPIVYVEEYNNKEDVNNVFKLKEENTVIINSPLGNGYGPNVNNNQFGGNYLPQIIPQNEIKSILEVVANLTLNFLNYAIKGLFIFGGGIIVSKALYHIFETSITNIESRSFNNSNNTIYNNNTIYDDNQIVLDNHPDNYIIEEVI